MIDKLHRGIGYGWIITMVVIFILMCFMCSCKVTKQIQKAVTETESKSEVDSSANVHNDIKRETKSETEITEVIDSAVFITPKGDLITKPSEVTKESIRVPIFKKKVTKTTEEKSEVDKTKSKTDLNKKEEKKEEVKTVVKDIKKTGIPFYWWIIIAVIVAGCLYWKFLRR